ncbi:hypothetical protein D4764_11G0008120 [Takifugu flavidus]|uniref:Macro domain-containing protein n=1 Tax=Takifugu flavidus TaxID=433684 RepID=A0A5C6PIH7_9TELE|nr:hypothetical protein D4764_11G0008120 [Takifugu flavidus]
MTMLTPPIQTYLRAELDVIHTVGPVARNQVGTTENNDLKSCYWNSLQLVKEHSLKTVAVPALGALKGHSQPASLEAWTRQHCTGERREPRSSVRVELQLCVV